LGRVLIKHRYPFIVLPTNYFLKNIDDIGQITKLRQEKNQESFLSRFFWDYFQLRLLLGPRQPLPLDVFLANLRVSR